MDYSKKLKLSQIVDNLYSNDVQSMDLSDFNVVHSGVDTIKQKATGRFKSSFSTLPLRLETDHRIDIDVLGNEFSFTKAPRASGYRYMCRNAFIGIHIFMGSYHVKEWADECLFKCEISPQVIKEHGLYNVHQIIDSYANYFLENVEYTGVEAHLCVDVQGWKPERDFLENVTTYSKVSRCFNTSMLVSADLSTTAVKYANSESFLIGKASSSQLAVYNKTVESSVTGKRDWWNLVYSESPKFDQEKDVFRIELRLPSRVTQTLVDKETGEDMNIRTTLDIIGQESSMMRYGLYSLFRYHFEDSSVVRPEWQKIVEQNTFNNGTGGNEFFYKRVANRVKNSSIERNVPQLIGHLTSCMAKDGNDVDDLPKVLKSLPFYNRILDYFAFRGFSAPDMYFKLSNMLREKIKIYSMPENNPFFSSSGYCT